MHPYLPNHFPVNPIFSSEEITHFPLLPKQEYLNQPFLKMFPSLPRISVSIHSPETTEEEDRVLLDISNQENWAMSTHNGIDPKYGKFEQYDVLEKVGKQNKGKIIICLNNPFVAYLHSLPINYLKGMNVVIMNPGVTQEVIDGNNQALLENNKQATLIHSPNDAFMSIKNQVLLRERGANPHFWEPVNSNNEVQEFKDFIKNKQIRGIVVNGGSSPAASEWIIKHLETIHELIISDPQSWCAMLCAPIYVLNSGPLLPTYEADVYSVPTKYVEYGTGYVGNNIAVFPHFRAKRRHFRSSTGLSSLKPFFHSKNKVVVDIPDNGVFIY